MSLAIQQGQGINAITKAIGDIQNDLLKIESQNAVDAVKPQITKDIYNIYEEAIKADDTDKALTLFYNNTSPKNFTQLLKGQTPLVKKILTSEILKLTSQKPLFGHKSGKRSKTHWITFMKE